MSRLSWNVAANLIGRAWTALLSLALVPLYVSYMGIEAYGLVGFFVTLQAVFSLLDTTLGTTASRELARMCVTPGAVKRMPDFVRTLEVVIWSFASLVALAVVAIAPIVARSWLRSEVLSETVIWQAISLMGLAIALQLPAGLYAGGLLGLQRQVLYNCLLIGTATFRGLGAVAVLHFAAPTVVAYFAWQIVASMVQTGMGLICLWAVLPSADRRAMFKLSMLKSIGSFAGGMAAISVLAVLLMQIDKVVLSTLLTLTDFGYYSLASLVASGLYVVVYPIFTAILPRLSQLVSLNDAAALRRTYHVGAQAVSLLLFPLAIVVFLFTREVLLLWTRDQEIASNVSMLVRMLIIGTMLNGLMNIPYALQLAYGWTKLTLLLNLVATMLLVPLLLFTTSRYGAPGAALVWLLLNAGYVLVGIQVMHTRLLPHDKLRWYCEDVLLPFAGALAGGLAARYFVGVRTSTVGMAASLIAGMAMSFGAAALLTPFTAEALKRKLRTGKVGSSYVR